MSKRQPAAVAIVCARNEAVHIERCLNNLISEGLSVILIDHESSDRTRELASAFLGKGLRSIENLPWTGEFALRQQLAAKAGIVKGLQDDWILHVDADEWLSSPRPGESLLEGIIRVDEAGYNAINFNEFVFIPKPGEDLYRPDYAQRSTRYYRLLVRHPFLMRAWKRSAHLNNQSTAGHLLSGKDVRRFPEDFVLRHYIFLSEEHARRKYRERRYASTEIMEGWHGEKALAHSLRLSFPDNARIKTLERWDSKDFDLTNPETQHYWEW